MELDDVLANGVNGKLDKGKARAASDEESDDSIVFPDSEFVVCTLDVTKVGNPYNVGRNFSLILPRTSNNLSTLFYKKTKNASSA